MKFVLNKDNSKLHVLANFQRNQTRDCWYKFFWNWFLEFEDNFSKSKPIGLIFLQVELTIKPENLTKGFFEIPLNYWNSNFLNFKEKFQIIIFFENDFKHNSIPVFFK